MELPLSLVRGLSMMRHIVNVRVVDDGDIVGARVDRDAVINDKRISISFCQKTDALVPITPKIGTLAVILLVVSHLRCFLP